MLQSNTFVQAELDVSKNKNISKIKMNRDLINININIKKTVMTIPYNITLFGVKEQFRNSFEVYKDNNKVFYKVEPDFTKDNNVIYLLPKEVYTLGEIVYNGILNNLPSLRTLSEYLDLLLTILLKLDLPVIWITPSGLKISLSNLKFNKIKLKHRLCL